LALFLKKKEGKPSVLLLEKLTKDFHFSKASKGLFSKKNEHQKMIKMIIFGISG